MRLCIHLERIRGNFLPFSINYALQSFFYSVVSEMNPEVGHHWHHERKIKPWTFSSLKFEDRFFVNRKKNGFTLQGRRAKLYVSSVDDPFIFALLQGLSSKKKLSILGVDFEIVQIQTLFSPKFEEGLWHHFTCLSGYCASERNPSRRYINFYTAIEDELIPQLMNNTRKSYLDYTGDAVRAEGKLEIVLDKIYMLRQKIGYISQYKQPEEGGVKIFANSVPLSIKGDPALISFVYQAGLGGERTSAGFGMLEYQGASEEPVFGQKRSFHRMIV